ncbi:SDR family oxidoreductase [uncultured Citricoccus sp.]|uniref:SDR family NAD(P)-dependent oxidoreductase n=1 Tax=uncultured Citricoccus sp. TaxID=614031 RepID=UPI003418B069
MECCGAIRPGRFRHHRHPGQQRRRLPPASFEELTVDLIDFHCRVNQLGVFLGLRAVYEHMKSRGTGAIINVSSISGLGALPGHAAYGTTKWAVRGLTKYAAVEFGRHGIRVNSTTRASAPCCPASPRASTGPPQKPSWLPPWSAWARPSSCSPWVPRGQDGSS